MKRLKIPQSKFLILILKITLSLGLIGYFIWKLSAQHGGLGPMAAQLLDTLKGAKPLYLGLALLLHPVGFALTTWRWRILLRPFGGLPCFSKLYRIYFMSAFFNNFMPSTMGGDAVRALVGKQFSGSLTRSATVVLIERLSGMFALFTIATLGVCAQFLSQGQQKVWLFGVTLLPFILGILALIFLQKSRLDALPERWQKRLPQKLVAMVNKLLETLAGYRQQPSALYQALSVSLLFQTSMVFYFFLICRAMAVEITLFQALIGIPVIIVMLMVVPAINGLGVRATGFGALLGLSAVTALGIEAIDIALRLIIGLIGGVLFITQSKSSGISDAGKAP